MKKTRLGINIDHVATLRNARGGWNPDPVRAALLAQESGADGITAHLREDRRHIRDDDIKKLKQVLSIPLNFEMAATAGMKLIAMAVKPNACCLVPEKREEVTTEGGLDVAGQLGFLEEFIKPLKDIGIRVSLFVDPDERQIEAAYKIGADIVEIHTGAYCNSNSDFELKRIVDAADVVSSTGLECHAGHGLNYDNVARVAAIENMVELNIGHFLIGEAVYVGLEQSIRQMRELIDKART